MGEEPPPAGGTAAVTKKSTESTSNGNLEKATSIMIGKIESRKRRREAPCWRGAILIHTVV